MLLKNSHSERGGTVIEVAAWVTTIAVVLGISGFVILRARSQSTAASLTQDQQAYVNAVATQRAQAYVIAVATQQAETYVSAIATQAAAPVRPAAPSPTALAPVVRVPTAQPNISRPPTPPPIPPTESAPATVPPTVRPPAPLRFTAERVLSAVQTPFYYYITANFEDTSRYCNPASFDPQTDMWMIPCVVTIGRGGVPQGVTILVDDGTGDVYCVRGCAFFPSCLPTPLGCKYQYSVSP